MGDVVDAALAAAGKPIDLGSDPAKYLEKFEDWYEHTKLLAESIGIRDDKQKLRLALLWGGKELRKIAKDAKVDTDKDEETLATAIEKIREACGKHVNLTMAMFRLMHAKQDSKTVTQFLSEIDELATQCQFEKQQYDKERAMKDAFIFGTSDDKLRQEALAKDLTYNNVVKAALGYEQSRKAHGTIKQEGTSGAATNAEVRFTQEEVDQIVARVTAGKYSGRNPQGQKAGNWNQCPNCPPHYRPHREGKCPAVGKTCAACKRKDHFAKSRNCKAGQNSINKLEEYAFEEIQHIEVISKIEPETNHASIKINGIKTDMFVDSGCRKTLVPKDKYHRDMGQLQPSSIKLRPYGTQKCLEVLGEMNATLECIGGSTVKSTIYIVEGHLAQPLLGDTDAKAMGILQIDPNGKPEETVAGITANLEKSNIRVETRPKQKEPITAAEQGRINIIISKFPNVIKNDDEAGSGLLLNKAGKIEEVEFHIDHTVPPVSAPYKPIPLAYQARLSEHLQQLRKEDKIEDVDPNTECPWVSNVVITEKKAKNQIRMNVDMRAPNKAISRTKCHIETIQEVRHRLKGATRFSELDLGHGYHQIALKEESRQIATFQTHEGLHRFKVLFFGASPASDLFHDRIKTALHGIPGVMSIHDNILVWGKTPEEHEANLEACLERLKERRLTVRKAKCNFGCTAVSWFGWIFSEEGMAADPRKVEAIKTAGRPQNTDDVKSFLQACQFNAKFMIDSNQAYAQMTKPLRNLTKHRAIFRWTTECEEAYEEILKAMTSAVALRPFDPSQKTHLVTDASPEGIAASVFQTNATGNWVPIDHTSRSLTECERNYSQIERESLAQAWGMNAHRYYLLGIDFDSHTDHQPLIAIYGGNKKGNARVERHRLKVQGFRYTMKHLPGKENPCDYGSRHPIPLEQIKDADMVIDHNDELCISTIVTEDLPDAITADMVRQATSNDKTLQKIIACVHKGYIDSNPELKEYRQVFSELAVSDGILLRGDKLVIPEADVIPGNSMRRPVVDLAHEGHQGTVKTKQLLRSKVWFPHLDKMVEDKISECLGCQATTYVPTRDPLQPSRLPDYPWQRVAMDFWGPLPTGGHVLLVIDEYSRYAEVEFVKSTSSTAVLPHLDRIFSTHGFPEQAKTDGGPPFNGYEYKRYMQWAGIKATIVSPEDPEANGLAENFMKSIKKVCHTARIEGKCFKQEMYKFLRQYRSTSHSTTGKPPAELLFGRTIRTKLPDLITPTNNTPIKERHDIAKQKQKEHKDNKRYVKPHNINVGDRVLLLQKETKLNSRYDPVPYKVTVVQGTQITAVQGEKTRRRDAKHFKKIPARTKETRIVPDQGEEFEFEYTQPDLQEGPGTPTNQQQEQPQTETLQTPQTERLQTHPLIPRPRQHEYPNGHLEPNIDTNLPRGQRRRLKTDRYSAV